MLGNFKKIHLGKLIAVRMQYKHRVSRQILASKDDIEQMCDQQSLDSQILLRWSKLLKYDFFRIYSQHLILYSPQYTPKTREGKKESKTSLPELKKNVYTQEIVRYATIVVNAKVSELTL